MNGYRSGIYQILKYLERESDPEHPVSSAQIIAYLETQNIFMDRKTVYRNIAELNACGVTVETVRRKGFYLDERIFDLPELKLLVDAVQSSRFLTKNKSLTLISKLESLTSRHYAQLLSKQVYVLNRVKSMNESVFNDVDYIQAAITQNRQISFLYFDYAVPKKRVYRHGGKRYQISPYYLVWDNENYYLVAFDREAGIIKHFRVDKMEKISILKNARDGMRECGSLDMATYTGSMFGMFSGKTEQVRIRCENHLLGAILDRFGMETPIIPDGAEHFITRISVAVSDQFFGYLTGFGTQAELLSPDSVRVRYGEFLQSLSHVYTAKADG